MKREPDSIVLTAHQRAALAAVADGLSISVDTADLLALQGKRLVFLDLEHRWQLTAVGEVIVRLS